MLLSLLPPLQRFLLEGRVGEGRHQQFTDLSTKSGAIENLLACKEKIFTSPPQPSPPAKSAGGEGVLYRSLLNPQPPSPRRQHHRNIIHHRIRQPVKFTNQFLIRRIKE